MPDEAKSTVSLEDLEDAAEGIMDTATVTDDNPPEPSSESSAEENLEEEETQEEIEEEPQEPEIPDEPTDHVVRSKLGRRVSAIETKIDSFMDEMRFMMQKKNPDEFDEDEIDPDEPLTLRQLEKWEEKKAESANKYNADYDSQIHQLEMEEEDETFQAEVMKEFLQNHNFKRSNNGKNDAKLNYLNAQIAVLKKSKETKENPLGKNKGKEVKGLGTPSGSKSDTTKGTVIKLDPDTKEFLDYIRSTPGGESWTDEKVSEIMGKEPKTRHSRFKR